MPLDEMTPGQLKTTLTALGRCESYEEWKCLLAVVAENLGGDPTNPLLDAAWERAQKDVPEDTEDRANQVFERMKKIIYDCSIGVEPHD